MIEPPATLGELESLGVESHWNDTLERREEVALPEIATEHLDVDEVGVLLVEPEPFVALELDISHLQFDSSGAPLVEPEEFVPLQIDTSHIELESTP